MSDEEIRKLNRQDDLTWVDRFKLVMRHRSRPAESPADFMGPVFDKSQRTDQDDLRFSAEDVAVAIAETDLSPEEAYTYTEVVGVYALKDGRFGVASGTADSSGWG